MEFFDKLSQKASETYKYTSERTSKLAKEAKIKMQINKNKSKIEDIYKEIGKKVYMHHIKDEDIDIESVLEEYCIQIDQICDEVEDDRKELLTLKDKKQCMNCYDEIEINCNYCPNCGYEQVENECQNKEVKNESTAENKNEDKTEND